MAAVEATNTKLKANEIGTITAATATGTDGVAVDFTNKDDMRILLLLGGASGEATIEKGEMLQSVEDLVVEVSSTDEKAIVIESGKFMKMDGRVYITGLSGLTVKAIELP